MKKKKKPLQAKWKIGNFWSPFVEVGEANNQRFLSYFFRHMEQLQIFLHGGHFQFGSSNASIASSWYLSSRHLAQNCPLTPIHSPLLQIVFISTVFCLHWWPVVPNSKDSNNVEFFMPKSLLERVGKSNKLGTTGPKNCVLNTSLASTHGWLMPYSFRPFPTYF